MSVKEVNNKLDNNVDNLMSLYDNYDNESKEKKKIMMNTIEEDIKYIINEYVNSRKRNIPEEFIAKMQLYIFEYDMVNTKYSKKGLYEYTTYDAYEILNKITYYIDDLRTRLSKENNRKIGKIVKIDKIEEVVKNYLNKWKKNNDKSIKDSLLISRERIGASSSGYYGEKGEKSNDRFYQPTRNRTIAGKKKKRKKRTMKKRK